MHIHFGRQNNSSRVSTLACSWILLNALNTGLAAAMGATGAAVLRNNYPHAYDVGSMAAATALGSTIITGGITLLLWFCLCLYFVTPGLNDLSLSTSTTTSMVGSAIYSAGSSTLGALLGYSILNTTQMSGMALGSTAAAAAVGGAIIGVGASMLCAGPTPDRNMV